MLQDKILDTAADENQLTRDNNLLLLNNLDFGINALLVIVAVILGLTSCFDSSVLFLVALCNFVLGVYQLVSAIVGSLRGNNQKRNYLIIASVYLIILWLGSVSSSSFIPADLETAVIILVVLILPLAGAGYFTYLCFKAKSRI
jgi:uncharacterized membrane-anchored protein